MIETFKRINGTCLFQVEIDNADVMCIFVSVKVCIIYGLIQSTLHIMKTSADICQRNGSLSSQPNLLTRMSGDHQNIFSQIYLLGSLPGNESKKLLKKLPTVSSPDN